MARRNFVLITQESSYPQMGGLYLASALDAAGIETHIIPSGVSCDVLDELVSKYDPIAVGCSVMTAPEILDFVRHSIHIQRTYNACGCQLPVVWGGMHPTIVTMQTLAEPYIDFVVSGEAEITLPQLLTDLTDGHPPESKLVTVETPAHLDQFRPQWERIDIGKYLFSEAHSVHAKVDFHREHIFYYLLTSRGCAYKCNFCWEIKRAVDLRAEGGEDLVWRAHSTEWIESQLDYLQARLAQAGLAMDGVGLWDDMIFGRGRSEHTTRARRVFEIMRDRNLGYLLEARANQLISTTDQWNGECVTREAGLYRYLKETGCMQVFVGTESASQETLNLIQKGTKVTDYRRLVEISRDIGLPLRFSMIVGFPRETDESVNQTLDFIEELDGEPFISVSGPKLFTPYPGTPQYQMAIEAGMTPPATTLDWARLNRYADFRGLFPWLRRNCTEATLRRIDGFFDRVSAEKKHQPSEKTILELVRGH